MKRLICIFLMLCVLLTGCGEAGETVPTTQMPTTEPRPTLLEQADIWDEAGVLLELPLVQLNDSTDLRMEIFGEHLLLWSVIYDSGWITGVRSQLLELDYGTVVAEQTVKISDWVEPQIQENRICVCDSFSGKVTILDGNLSVSRSWSLEPDSSYWIMGFG